MGRSDLWQLFMLKGFFSVLLCSVIVAGHVRSQEVIVARETKPEAPKQAAPSPEETPSESPAPEPTKSKSRERKSASGVLTLEQMRKAGALAAERLENRTSPPPARTRGPESEPAATESSTEPEIPKPFKREARTRPTPRPTKPEPIGAIRPTMMESGRQEPSATPSGKAETRGERSPAP